MAYLGKHENIVEFLGAVTNQLKNRICFAIVELSPYGDLLTYVRKSGPQNPFFVHLHLYANLANEVLNEGHDSTKLGKITLSCFCEQIAAGMEFVCERKVIHEDLAARNVLVFPDNVVKISDFGLSQQPYKTSNYQKRINTPLPWRWMAIESLKYMEFSSMTDMWAFGVTAWEIYNMGVKIFVIQEYIDSLICNQD